MSVLKGFLQPSPMEETKEVIISERFKGEDGKPLPFKIRKIDSETADSLMKRCRRRERVNGQVVTEVLKQLNDSGSDAWWRSNMEGHSLKVAKELLPDMYELCNSVKEKLEFNDTR